MESHRSEGDTKGGRENLPFEVEERRVPKPEQIGDKSGPPAEEPPRYMIEKEK